MKGIATVNFAGGLGVAWAPKSGRSQGDWTWDIQLAKLLRDGDAHMKAWTMECVTEIAQTGRHPISRYPFLACSTSAYRMKSLLPSWVSKDRNCRRE
jgi:hypothetical protein